jgi:hypothetical protein
MEWHSSTHGGDNNCIENFNRKVWKIIGAKYKINAWGSTRVQNW